MRAWLLIIALLGSFTAAAESQTPVILFSQTYCPVCLAAKQFFLREGIAYQEYDIETSDLARRYFDKLGGQGTPLLLVNGRRLEGFDEIRFRRLYELPTTPINEPPTAQSN